MRAPTRSWLARGYDVLMPVTVGVFLFLIVGDTYDGEDAAPQRLMGFVLSAVSGGALYWRGRHPELVAVVVIAAGVGYHFVAPEAVVPFAVLFAVGAVAARRPLRVSLPVLAGGLGVAALNLRTAVHEDTLFTLAMIVAAWALGEAARNRQNAIDQNMRRAVADEQARIARELHDVIAHSVSVIVVQAAAADDVFDERPDQARASLRAIEASARDALGELRLLLADVRPDADGEPRPQPGLARLDDLAEPLRAAGLEVAVRREGAARALPASVDLSAYRIVQEALTNTLRHARATRAEVTVRYGDDGVEVDVCDDGRATMATGGDSPGHGLLGMRERATLHGGTLEAGPLPRGGYRVHARLPLEASP